jgi:phosphatidate cytidylyltransferase
MLRWRLTLGTLLIAALVALCWLDHTAEIPGIWLMPVLLAFGILATQELLQFAEAAGLHPSREATYCGNLLVLISPWMMWLAFSLAKARGWSNLELFTQPFVRLGFSLVAMAAAVLVVFLVELIRYRQPGGVLANIASAVFVIGYVGLMLAFVVQLRLDYGVGALASLVIVVKMCDTGAYFVGRLIGRHKLIPRVSPGKTIEGSIGGLVAAVFASYATFTWLVPIATPRYFDLPAAAPRGWLVFGLAVGLAGMIGDLAESLLKRDVGKKDSSTWLPGFGGVMDILDSVLLAAPLAYLCWAMGIVGR